MNRVASCIPIIFAVLTACSSPLRATDRVRAGAWGGPGVSLEVTDQGGRIELDCAHGTLDQVLDTDSAGEFRAAGTYTAERPGPQREDDPPRPRRATYAGRADARTMTLTITLTDIDEKVGPFTLTFGVTGRLRKCL